MILGLNHLTLAVADVDRALAFYVDVLGLSPAARWPQGAYLLAGEVWVALVMDEMVRKRPLPEYTHFAFTVAPQDFAALSRRILESGAPIWQDNATEGDSLYFTDPDGHKLEIHASDLAARLQSTQANPWPGLEIFHARRKTQDETLISGDKQSMTRQDGRSANQLRPITFIPNFTKWAEGSVLAQFGDTHVLCNVTLEDTLPNWLRYSENPQGWLTAEYAMLPRSTHSRTRREQRWPKGRTQEISRLIGRSLRMALDLTALGERTLTVDCDVLQADGGTRTAAITGGWVAVNLALRPLIEQGELPPSVLRHQVAAISVGIVDGQPLLDLPYSEDVAAEVDFNVVMTAAGDLIEVQGTAEKAPFPRAQLDELLDLAAGGIQSLAEMQRAVVG